MKQRLLWVMLSVWVVAFAGCKGQPCFYQDGTTIEQAERDLLQCIHDVEISVYVPDEMLGSLVGAAGEEGFTGDLTCLCMESRGYVYLNADALPQGARRRRIISPVQDYWIAEGVDTAPPKRDVQGPDPDLRRVIERWPELSVELRKTIVEMVRP